MGMRLGRASLRLMRDGEDREFLHLDGGNRVEHVDLDLLSLTGAFAMQQCGERALERRIGGHGIDQVLSRRRRRLALAPRR